MSQNTYNTCANCHHEIVNKVKTSSEPCKTCYSTSNKSNPFPAWKQVDKTKEKEK